MAKKVLPSGWFKFAADSDRENPADPGPHDKAAPSGTVPTPVARTVPPPSGTVPPPAARPVPPPSGPVPVPAARPTPPASGTVPPPAARTVVEPSEPAPTLPEVAAGGTFAVFLSRNGYRLMFIPTDGGPPVDMNGVSKSALRQLRSALDGVLGGA